MEPSTATETARELLTAFRSLKPSSDQGPLVVLKQKLDKAESDLKVLDVKLDQLEKLRKGDKVNVSADGLRIRETGKNKD